MENDKYKFFCFLSHSSKMIFCQLDIQNILVQFISFFFLFIGLSSTEGASPYTPQYGDPFSEPWRWQQFEELSGKGCRCMTEDREGVLWFGVNGGVLKYNGIQWQYYQLGKDSSDTPVTALCTSSNNEIYAGSSRGIYKFESGSWEKIEVNVGYGDSLDFPHNRFPIIEASDKSIWIGTKQGALRIQNGIMNLYRENEFFPDVQIKNMYIDEILDLPEFDIYSIYEERPHVIWCGLRDGRIYRCLFQENPVKPSPVWQRIDNQEGYVRARFPLINSNDQGKIFIISGEIEKGVNIYDGRKWTQYEFLSHFNVNDVHTDILKSRNGDIWITAGSKVFAFANNKWHDLTKLKLSLPRNRWFLYLTKDNCLWIIGLSSEVWRLDLSNKKWTTFQGILFQSESPSGEKWFLTYDGAIVKTDSLMNDWTRFGKNDGVIEDPVGIYITRNGHVWCAGSHNQVAATACYDGKRWIKQVHPKLSWGIDQRAVFETADGSLWFGGCGDILIKKGFLGGLVRYINPDNISENQKCEYHFFNKDFSLSAIYGIGQTADGTIWVGENALYRFNEQDKQFQKASEPANINDSFIDCISTSPAGNLWIGTRACGVFWYESTSGKWTQYTMNNGLSSNTIMTVFADSDSNVWVTTDKNICHFDGKNWTSNVFSDNFKIRRTRFSIQKTSNGFYWFHQIPQHWLKRTLHKNINPSDFFETSMTVRYKPDKIPPATFITFSQERIAQPGNVFLSWKAQDLCKSTPDELLQYSYRLDNNQWSPFTFKTNHIFLDIKDGQHTFEVRARDRDLNVDPIPAKVSFYVIPPTWKQSWFIGLILFFLSTITFFIFFLIHRNKIIRDLSDSKTRFFTNISHELLTPLTLISGPVNTMLDSIDKRDQWFDRLNIVSRNCNRLTKLVGQLLTFQKMESGRLLFNPVKGDIISLVQDVALSFQTCAHDKQVDFQTHFSIDHLYMYFDPDKIEKILFNLLSNAFKYTPANGKILLDISQVNGRDIIIECADKKRTLVTNWLVILVKDSGIGIPKEKTDKIFSRFYRIEDPSTNHITGAGIGLSLTKDLVGLHFGNISVKSENKKGTEFLVKIPVLKEYPVEDNVPLKHTNVKKAHLIKEKVDAGKKNGSKMNGHTKVLIIEDNLDMRVFIREELADYEVIEAGDGKDGLEQVLKKNPDIIISDIMMPHMDGITFCQKIKGNEKTSHIPIILLTARTLQDQKLEGLETGADDYLTKPFDSKELKIRIKNILDSRRKLWQKFQKNILVNPKEITITSIDEQFLNRAIDIVEKHMDDPDFDPQGFAREIGMSRTALYSKIKSLTGSSVRDFIVTIRLKRAGQLLKKSGLTVTEITFEVGFKNPSHFAKAFKQQFGVLPSDYIKQNFN